MKNKNNNLWSAVLMAVMGMSLTRMPYSVVSITFIIGMIFILFCIFKLYFALKGDNKKHLAYFGALISVFMGYLFFFLNRTIEEFNILIFMEKQSFFIGVFFIILMIIMIFIIAAPQIKKTGGFANMIEEQNPGSWIVMKICFWIVILGLIFAAGMVVWEHFFK